MGAHHDPGGPARDVQQGLASGGHGHAAREQGDAGGTRVPAEHPGFREGPERGGDLLVVLGGEHLGGREHRGLATVVHHLQHGTKGHHGLAGPHVTLQQPVHGRGARELVRDLLPHLALSRGQRERQGRVETREDSVLARRARIRRVGRVLRPPADELGLQDERFLEAEPTAGPLVRLDRLGAVQVPVGPAQGRQLLRVPQLRGERVLERVQVSGEQQLLHHLADPRRGQLAGLRVHRDGHQLTGLRRGSGHGLGGLHGCVVRPRHGQLTPVELGFAREQGQGPHREVLLRGVGVEERDLQLGPGVVRHHDVRETAPGIAAHAAGAGGLHAGHERRPFPGHEVRERLDPAPVDVAPRCVVQQLAHGGDSEVLGEQGHGGARRGAGDVAGERLVQEPDEGRVGPRLRGGRGGDLLCGGPRVRGRRRLRLPSGRPRSATVPGRHVQGQRLGHVPGGHRGSAARVVTVTFRAVPRPRIRSRAVSGSATWTCTRHV